jgi:glycosyltransferase involved in cell wall biosynthesis/ubiquinone/menaquinone biosynthesis C-methylase UbiE
MPVNVLYVHGVTEMGGAERDLLTLLAHLDRARVRPLVALPDRGPLFQLLRDRGEEVVVTPIPAWRKLKTFPLRVPALFTLWRLIRSRRIGLVHVNDYWYIPLAQRAAAWAGVACVAHVRQEIEPHRLRQYRMGSVDRLLTVSDQIRETALRAGLSPERMQTCYSGLDLDRLPATVNGAGVRARHGFAPRTFLVGTVANLFPRKGYQHLIRAISLAAQQLPELGCLIVGEGDAGYRTELERLTRDLGLADRVVFAGFQPDVYPYLAALDLFVLPSVMEGFGIALLEAMAMRRPVVATKVGGVPEVVEDGVTGLLVPPADAAGLAQAIVSLAEAPDLRRALGEAGARRVRERFHVAKMARQIEAVYEEVLKGDPGVGPVPPAGPQPDAALGVHEVVLDLLKGEGPGRVLDAPAGEGALAQCLMAVGFQAVCGDIQPERFRAPGIGCERLDLDRILPYPDGSFDAVTCVEGIEHLENPHHTLREFARLLRPGGCLVISTPNVTSVKSRLRFLLYGYPSYFDLMVGEEGAEGEGRVAHLNPISFLELRHALSQAGFAVERVTANRCLKRRSPLYRLLAAFIRTRGRSGLTGPRPAAVRRHLLGEALLFGEILVLKARKL